MIGLAFAAAGMHQRQAKHCERTIWKGRQSSDFAGHAKSVACFTPAKSGATKTVPHTLLPTQEISSCGYCRQLNP